MTFRPIPVLKRAVSVFSILSLFASGEQGAIYDFSDMSTLFQDSAGTIPVTAVEQPVGLVLDKRKGLVPDASGTPTTFINSLIPFDTFTPYGTWFVGVKTGVGRADAYPTDWLQTIAVGEIYKVTVRTGASHAPWTSVVTIRFTSTTNARSTVVTIPSMKNTTTTWLLTVTNAQVNASMGVTSSAAGTIDIESITWERIPGNHAKQTTSTARPILSARNNLLLNSELLTAWTKVNSTITATGVTLPTSLAPTFLYESTTTNGYFRQTYANATTGKFTFSIYAKYANTDWVYVYFTSIANSGAWFNVATGTLGSIASGSSAATITPDEDGGYILSITSNAEGVAFYPTIKTVNGDASSIQTIGQQALFTKGQLEVGGVVTKYQWITTATNYNSVGFPLKLRFDGIDDFLVTQAIDFSATDKITIVAGVRKNSDAAFGNIVESWTNAFSVAWTFALFANGAIGAGAKYGLLGKWSSGYATDYQTYTSPISNVLTAQFDIAQSTGATEQTLRVNGVIATSSAATGTSIGTGNFSNNILYIGRRAGTSLPFSGEIYSLVIRGATTTPSDITATENWTNTRTQAY